MKNDNQPLTPIQMGIDKAIKLAIQQCPESRKLYYIEYAFDIITTDDVEGICVPNQIYSSFN